MMRTGVYTGSFDPFHKGHIKIVSTILKKDIVDRVFIIPSDDYWDKKMNMSHKDRCRLVEMSFRNRKCADRVTVNEKLGSLTYTYQLFRRLKKEYPDDEFYLIAGGDNMPRFREWRNYKELLKNGFIIVNRNTEDLETIMKDLAPRSYVILEIEGISDISSTYIRENLNDYSKISGMINRREYGFVLSHMNK
ncbi:MAG: nicotinate-nicotinamide nucleotide adenylyltransferase [Erysipelotrichaceae bacterium]|nr:nicotinate-nicotinamide nucleotide adenylyltransferase [Erysipelotrichaceae bacterium]